MEDEKVKIYNQGFKAGNEHRTSSPETKEKFNEIYMELTYIKKDIKEIKDNMITVDKMDLANERLCKSFMKECERRFASKLIERIVFAGGGAIGLWILYKIIETNL